MLLTSLVFFYISNFHLYHGPTNGFESLCQDKDVSKQPDNVNEQASVVTTTQKQVNDEIERQQNIASKPQDLSRNKEQAFARNGRVQKIVYICQKGKTYKCMKI